MKTPDVVLLLPGFFGFDHFESFYYFADRVSATLRGHVEAEAGAPFPVIPLATGPADGLAHRQKCFLDAMHQIDRALGGVDRIHLIGHSTGGLDADLLLCKRPLNGEKWSDADQSIRRRIASVTTLAAPLYGTTLALADISRFAAEPFANAKLVGSLIPATAAIAAIVPERLSTTGAQLLGGAGAVYRFLRQMLYRRELLSELAPAHVEQLRETNPRELTDVPVTCFVTCPLPNLTPSRERATRPDAFFLYLTNHTAGARVHSVSSPVRANIARLNDPKAPVIASPSEPPRPPHLYDENDNDAVVNSARQLEPKAALGAIVYADHADVLGHYDRRDPLHPNRFVKEGVFRSGAHFGDNEFFELYRRVASIVVSQSKRPAKPIRKTATQPKTMS